MLTVLMVDDKPDLLRMRQLCYGDKYTIYTADTLEEALVKARELSFEILVADKNLGYHRGIEPLLNFMKEEKPDTTVIIWSGEDGERAKKELYCHEFYEKGSPRFPSIDVFLERVVKKYKLN